MCRQEEHEEIIRRKELQKEEKLLTWTDTKSMEMTTRVIHETMRFASVISFAFREAVKDVEYEGGCIGLQKSIL
jgi:cytochrome P450